MAGRALPADPALGSVTPASKPDPALALDAIELELRLLPGVVGVGLDPGQDRLAVYLCLGEGGDPAEVRRRASEVLRSHVEGPVAIELEGTGPSRPAPDSGGAPSRVALVWAAPDRSGEEIEVHLAYGGARAVGRGRPGDQNGAVLATLDALDGLGARLELVPSAVACVSSEGAQLAVVVLRGPSGEERLGVAKAEAMVESVAKATLNALNRLLERRGALRLGLAVPPSA
jgi:hypothetical protein